MKELQFRLGLRLVAAIALLFTFALGVWTGRRVRARPVPLVLHQLAGGGRWQHQASQDHNTGNWQAEVQHFDDDSIRGRVIVVGGALDHATIEGQVSGTEVYGALVDDNGYQVGSFSGALVNGAFTGNYTTADGDSGSWTYDGPLPQLTPTGVQTFSPPATDTPLADSHDSTPLPTAGNMPLD